MKSRLAFKLGCVHKLDESDARPTLDLRVSLVHAHTVRPAHHSPRARAGRWLAGDRCLGDAVAAAVDLGAAIGFRAVAGTGGSR